MRDPYARRLERLHGAISQEGIDAFLVLSLEGSDYPNLFYLTGFRGSFGIFIADDDPLFLTDPRYTEKVRREVPELPLKEVRGRWTEPLKEELRGRGIRNIGINSRTTTLKLLEVLEEGIPGVEFVPLDGPIEKLRLTKDENEIELMGEAMEITEEGLSWALKRLSPGVAEREVALELEMWYRRNGAEDVSFELIVAFGENSSMPHYRPHPGERRLRRGDVVLFDVGVRYGGYCSDLTRTFAFGRPQAEFPEIYRAVLKANLAAIRGIRAGLSGVEADKLAREVIEEAGFGERFGHGLGHGVGIQVHEGPRLSPTSEDTLEPGMTVTVEPGIYLPGEFGVRIEDLGVVREGGLELLSRFPKDLGAVTI